MGDHYLFGFNKHIFKVILFVFVSYISFLGTGQGAQQIFLSEFLKCIDIQYVRHQAKYHSPCSQRYFNISNIYFNISIYYRYTQWRKSYQPFLLDNLNPNFIILKIMTRLMVPNNKSLHLKQLDICYYIENPRNIHAVKLMYSGFSKVIISGYFT